MCCRVDEAFGHKVLTFVKDASCAEYSSYTIPEVPCFSVLELSVTPAIQAELTIAAALVRAQLLECQVLQANQSDMTTMRSNR